MSLEAPTTRTVPESRTGPKFPVRDFNARLYSRCDDHRNEPCDCEWIEPSVSYCGRAISDDGRILIEDNGDFWSSNQLATCKSQWVCDFCSRRLLRDALTRAAFHVAAHLASGGQIVHLTLTLPHDLGQKLGPLLEILSGSASALKASKAWTDLGLTSWVQVLQVKWSLENGWHPHFHLILMLPAGELDVSALEEDVRSTWNNRVEKRAGRQPGRASTSARVMSSLQEALYPWRYGPDDDNEFEDQFHPDNYRDWWPGEQDFHPQRESEFHVKQAARGSMSYWTLARVAAKGCAQAGALWDEFYRATKGRQLVSYSRDLRDAWKDHEQTTEPPASEPVAFVESKLWNMVHFHGSGSQVEAGLSEGRWRGVEAMAQLWADVIGRELEVAPSIDGLPFVRLLEGSV